MKITSIVSRLSVAMVAAGLAVPAQAEDPVTPERLLNAGAEPENWLMNHKEFDSNRYSQLDQINQDNVGDLRLAFTVPIGGLEGGGRWAHGSLQGTPLVNDGMMYVTDGWGLVYKIDVRSGKSGRIVWIMDPGVDKADVWLPANRGVSLWQDQVISVTGNGHVISMNAATGEVVWDVEVDEDPAYSLTSPPLVVGDKLIVGGSGADRGARDHMVALDAATGEELWKWWAIPGPGEPGHETWACDNNCWEHGGGAMWVTGSYDPASNLTLWGTGNPVPMFDSEYRPGDNLYTNSSVAVDVDTGELKWYFQYTPNDYLDYDEVGSHLLYDVEIDGEMRQALGHFGRNGFYYDLDRNTGQFLHAAQYVQQLNWTAGIDPKTGKPLEYDSSKLLQEYAQVAMPRLDGQEGYACPHLQGGVNMWPTSYSANTGLAYGAGIEGCFTVTVDRTRSDGTEGWNGGNQSQAGRLGGSLAAVDPTTGETVKRVLYDYPIYSGVLSTAGGIVMTALMDGTILAHDDETLEELWSFNVGTGINAPPMTYAVDGKQYVAILVGMGAISVGRLADTPELADMQPTSTLYVFAL